MTSSKEWLISFQLSVIVAATIVVIALLGYAAYLEIAGPPSPDRTQNKMDAQCPVLDSGSQSDLGRYQGRVQFQFPRGISQRG